MERRMARLAWAGGRLDSHTEISAGCVFAGDSTTIPFRTSISECRIRAGESPPPPY